MIPASDSSRALVVVLVAGEDDVDAEAAEQRHEGTADPVLRAVPARGVGRVVQGDDHPSGASVGQGGG